jgi:hypothetical protein
VLVARTFDPLTAYEPELERARNELGIALQEGCDLLRASSAQSLHGLGADTSDTCGRAFGHGRRP